MERDKPDRAGPTNRRTRWTVIAIEFIVLFAFWVVLSGRYGLRYLLIGVGACALVTFWTHDLIYKPGRSGAAGATRVRDVFRVMWQWVAYAPWLVLAIIKANLQVAAILIKPHMPIDPVLLRFETALRRPVSLVTLANSITLTPGTITVDLRGRTYVVHALVKEAAGDLESGLMQNKVGAIFDDQQAPPPACDWAHRLEELKH